MWCDFEHSSMWNFHICELHFFICPIVLTCLLLWWWFLCNRFFCRDMQSYVSWAFLYFATGSNRVLILVDNRPWLMDNHSRPAKLWQLMVTKVCFLPYWYLTVHLPRSLILTILLQYRMSPFTNTRALQRRSEVKRRKNGNNGHEPIHKKPKRFSRWLPVIDSTIWKEMYMDLSKALHGFIVFEVDWKEVCGINYLNELQVRISSPD